MEKPKVLIVDPIHPHAIELLSERCEVQHIIHPPKDELIELLKDTDVIILRSGIKLPGDVIKSSDKLKIIARAGSGVDNIEIPAATEKGIIVFNVPGVSALSVAELTIGLLFSITRKISLADSWLRDNQWRKKECYGYELSGKTIGVVGLGKIGKKVALLAKNMGMNVLGYKKNINDEIKEEFNSEGITLVSSLPELLKESDFVSLNVPLTEDTRNLITLAELKLMKKESFLINTARGGVVNETDLYTALKENIITGAATDVFEKEKERTPLFELDNIVVTPHIGAMTYDAQKRIAEVLCQYVFDALDGKEVKTRMN